tara:strand:+ start:1779 stop:2837 length:1059 start_codon:yes stop_codon:yes gene_type:complete
MINEKLIVREDEKILKCLSKLNDVDIKCLIVVDKKKIVRGTLTDGDIRRAILRNVDSNSSIKKIYNKDFKFFFENNVNEKKISSILENKQNHIEIIPILKKNKRLKKIFSLNNFFKDKEISGKEVKGIKVVVMAGGLGKRLFPLTKKIPKALVKFKSETFLKIILENFFMQGFKNFGITLFHKKKMIKSYLNKIKRYKMDYFIEKKPLGTAGGLCFLKENKEKYIMVTNCDNFYKINYLDLFKYHKKYKYDFTIVASKKTLKLPYGICKIINEKFIGIEEKPEYSNFVNSGLYVMNRKVLDLLEKKKTDMDQLIDMIIRRKMKIGVYPIDEKSWIDVGTLSLLNSELNLDQK